MLHKFEEPCISGNNEYVENNPGSGAIFFCGCNLRCIYCQNHDISQAKSGKPVTINGLVDIFKQLENAGALNINLVTPTHYTKQIVEALKIYKPSIPIVWNSSGYENTEAMNELSGLVDIFLMDFKYFDNDIANKLSTAPNYPDIAKNAILKARQLIPNDEINEIGYMKKGLIVRHLVLPNMTQDSKNILEWIQKNLGQKTIVSLMSQYVPMHKAINHPQIGRKLKPIEYKTVVSYAQKLGFSNAYVQELSSSDTIYTPDFNKSDTPFAF